MNSPTQNPCHWRVSTLLSLDAEQVHELACWAVGTLTAYRLILGRCLLALHESKGYKNYGCSTAVHYGSSVLGISTRVARECKRVARLLQFLPKLTIKAERGELPWTKLREIVRVASPATEEYWLKLAVQHSAKKLQKLVSKTPVGQLPGDADVENTCTTEFRILATPELIQMFRQARRMLSVEQDNTVTGAETLECLLASFLATQPLDPEAIEKARQEADKDLQAERAREIPEIREAREVAVGMGLLSKESADEEETPVEEEISVQDLLTEAIGSVPQECTASCCSPNRAQDNVDNNHQDHFNDPAGGLGRPSTNEEKQLFQQLTEELNSWKNKRLRFNPKSRHTSKAQKQEILRRDGWQCSTPSCPNEAWLEIHHIKPYSEGGTTTPKNLLCICSSCHRNLHDGILKITPTAEGKLIFTDPSGRRLDEQADLELAAFLDFHCGWRGHKDNSHQRRSINGDWAVFAS